ncbi:MAG: hypothetical protein LBV08_06775 [Clostridiales bacterium]|nr:hypothetical protein [Clostridiales bacterium]
MKYFQNAKKIMGKWHLETNTFTVDEISQLPTPVQKYLQVCGYIGKTKMSRSTIYMPSSSYQTSKDKPAIKVDYIVSLFAGRPTRSIYKKNENIKEEILTQIDKGQLLSYLSECFLIPSSILEGYITWAPVDETNVKASIHYNGKSGNGFFSFTNDGFVKSFYTNDNPIIGADGNVDKTLIYEGFVEKDGVYVPTHLKAIWHEKGGHLASLDAHNIIIKFD